MFHTLFEACRAAGDSEGVSQVQAMVERLSLIALAPEAKTLVAAVERKYENGINGEGVVEARKL